MKTKTQQAIELVRQGSTVRQAARAVDVSESAVHAALRKAKAADSGICPCCGQAIKAPTELTPK